MTAPFALDKDAEALRAAFVAAGGRGFQDMTLTEARATYAASCAARPLAAPPMRRHDATVAGVAVRAYLPDGAPPAGPALLFCHGGGWVLGDLNTHDAICRRLAAAAAMPVIAVDYRLAPEHPFPAAFDDARRVAYHVAAAAPRWGIAIRALGLAGDSAGGTLVAALAQALQDEGTRPFCQLLFYPATDLHCATPSYTRFDAGLPLTAATMQWFIGQYVPDAAARSDQRCSPLRASSLANLCPAFIATAGADPLCDEGAAYADALSRAQVPVAHLHLPGQLHGFLTSGGALRSAGWALDAAGGFARTMAA